ncbi:MAG: helix-turn-helix domain containing protein [Caldilineaceae bacterium]|nr:helix-turn-helix domain containing protein [Caldilineaceae bacterium]
MKKQHIQLNQTERTELQTLLKTKKLPSRLFKRATALLALDQGSTFERVAELVDVTNDTVRAWLKRYEKEGIAGLRDKPRSGRPLKFDGTQRAQITALACSKEPEGYSDWNYRLLADKVVELGFCESISHTQVRTILKKTN